jgi:hypothetical protein
MTGPAAA